jgi:hypothetical protein
MAAGAAVGALGVSACSSGDALAPPSTADSQVDASTSPWDAGAMNAALDSSRADASQAHAPQADASQAAPGDAGSRNGSRDASAFDGGASVTSAFDAAGGESDADTAGDVDPGPYAWGDRTDIQEIFARYCFGCHGSTWQSCWSAQKNEGILTSAITSGAMPRNSTMSPMDKSALLAWLASGAPCAGPYEDAGVFMPPGGGTAPGAL